MEVLGESVIPLVGHLPLTFAALDNQFLVHRGRVCEAVVDGAGNEYLGVRVVRERQEVLPQRGVELRVVLRARQEVRLRAAPDLRRLPSLQAPCHGGLLDGVVGDFAGLAGVLPGGEAAVYRRFEAGLQGGATEVALLRRRVYGTVLLDERHGLRDGDRFPHRRLLQS